MANPKMINIPLVGGNSRYFGEQFDTEELVNMFVAEGSSPAISALVTIPGTVLSYTNTSGYNTRQLYSNGSNLFGVFSDEVVSFDKILTSIKLGNIATSSGYVGIKDNNSKQIMFVDGVNGWVYDFSTSSPTFTKITDPNFISYNNPIDCDYLDGHMFVGFGTSNNWIISNLGDAKTYSGLNFAELTSDGNEVIRGIRIVNRRIFIFGRQVTEIWYPTGASNSFPYKRDNNAILQYGCEATGSIAVGNLSNGKSVLCWLASEKQGSISIRVSEGGSADKISTPAIDYQIQKLSSPSDARGYIYRIDGHTFYYLNFIKDNLTLVYDFDSKYWHQQMMIDKNKYFSICHVYFNNKHYLGHNDKPELYELNSSYTSNNGEGIYTKRITPVFSAKEYQRTVFNRIQLKMRNGLGAVSDENNINPLLYIAHSDDGGATFSNSRSCEIGKLGEQRWQAVLTGFNQSYEHVFKIECFNSIKNIIEEMTANIDYCGY